MSLKSLSTLLLVISLFSCSQDSKENEVLQKPNVIYILADDLGYGDVGCYGQDFIKTPNIDKLAADGMLFTDHYAGSSVCAPSRASLMTGKHTGHSYVRGNYEKGPLGFGACLELRDQDFTLGELLKQADYQTSIIGKWGLGMDATTGEPIKQGFDYSYGYLNQGHAHNQFPEYLFENGNRVSVVANEEGKMGAFSNDIFTGKALDYLDDKRAESPFFLYMAYTTPHAELVLPNSESFENYAKTVEDKAFVNGNGASENDGNRWAYRSTETPLAAYAAQISHLDSCVGVLVNRIKELGIEDNTIIMFSSDNGPHREGGANPKYFKSAGEFRGVKRDLYEGGIRVPFIVKWPAKVEKGSVSEHTSAFWDLMPTLADIANQDIESEESDGVSFLPTLTNGTQKEHDYLYWEFHENPSSDQAVRKGKWKAIRHDYKGEAELYDLEKDRGEMNNVAAENPEIVKQMTLLLDNTRTPSEIWPLKSKKQ
ncbi:arylsulfatase [uncultured Arcticibacterium sp.]|uniref:arylsulfatase n=1 Tax=uncultured Arcticibacterium sp. TaxID=2173042 RepID=UPI0030F4FEE2